MELLKSFAVSIVVLVYDVINSIVLYNKEIETIQPAQMTHITTVTAGLLP